MTGLRPFLLVILAASAIGQVPEGCFDPPSNNALADIIVQAIEAFRPIMQNGIPSLNIPPLDPLGPLPRIPFRVDVPSIWLEGMVNDTYVRNLADFVICSVNITLGLSQKFDIEFRMENFHIDGFYDVDGLALSLFPIFGNGDYRLDTFQSGFSGGAKVSYNPLTDHAQLKDLHLDIYFDSLELELSCILGCGDMADLINGAASEIAPVMFNAVWDYISPILSGALQSGINEVLKNISISDVITPAEKRLLELGNGNAFVDSVMVALRPILILMHLDPASLPSAHLDFGIGSAELVSGHLTGLSSLHRDGTCTIDKVADWVFLYANVAVENLAVHYSSLVAAQGDEEATAVEIDAAIGSVAVYFVARKDEYTQQADIDQFIISEFGHIDVEIDGLGPLDYVVSPLTEAVVNSIRGTVSDVLETQVKQAIQEALNETPWPAFE